MAVMYGRLKSIEQKPTKNRLRSAMVLCLKVWSCWLVKKKGKYLFDFKHSPAMHAVYNIDATPLEARVTMTMLNQIEGWTIHIERYRPKYSIPTSGVVEFATTT